jgi:hypothetical protein
MSDPDMMPWLAPLPGKMRGHVIRQRGEHAAINGMLDQFLEKTHHEDDLRRRGLEPICPDSAHAGNCTIETPSPLRLAHSRTTAGLPAPFAQPEGNLGPPILVHRSGGYQRRKELRVTHLEVFHQLLNAHFRFLTSGVERTRSPPATSLRPRLQQAFPGTPESKRYRASEVSLKTQL